MINLKLSKKNGKAAITTTLIQNQIQYQITKILHMINIINVYKNKLCSAPHITKIVNKQYFKSNKEKLKIVVNVN